MHNRQQPPVVIADGFAPTVSVVSVHIDGKPRGVVVSRAAVADLARHAEITRALTAAGIPRRAIYEVLHGVRS
jgi:hypothetical protein